MVSNGTPPCNARQKKKERNRFCFVVLPSEVSKKKKKKAREMKRRVLCPIYREKSVIFEREF